MTTTVTLSGPLFDSRADTAVKDLQREAVERVGGQGLANVHSLLNVAIRNPTPYYETQLTVEAGADTALVHDRGVIYGPWLEGVGSRNATTRFKGYHSFRTARQELEGQVPALIEPLAARCVERLN